MSRGRVMLLSMLLVGCGDRRQPIKLKGDGGPAVVVVDPVKRRLDPVALIDEKEPDDDLARAQPLEPGKGVRGTIGAPRPPAKPGGKSLGDDDLYSWTEGGSAPDGGFATARIDLSGVPGVDLQLEALDGDGKRLMMVNDSGAGEGEVLANLAVVPGHTYYVRVHAVNPVAGEKPYELVMRGAPASSGEEREPNDDAPRATPLAALSDASGYYGRRRDEDWLSVPLQAPPGATLRIELTPVEGVVPQLRVLTGSSGLPTLAPPPVLAEARGGRGEELRLRNVGLGANPGASALVAIKAVEGRNADIRWSLRLAVEPPLDGAEREPNDSVDKAMAFQLAGPQQVSGFLWPGDADVYRLTGAADAFVTAELDALDRVDLKLERLAPDGRVLARADDAGPGKGERLPPWPGGDVLLRVSARARDVAFDAPYRLTVTPAPAEPDLEREPNNTAANATPWRDLAAPMRGYLAPKADEDVFRFTAPAGKAKVIAESAALVLRLSDEGKAPLGPAEAPGRASGPVTPGKTYLVTVKATSEKVSNPREPYSVTLRFE